MSTEQAVKQLADAMEMLVTGIGQFASDVENQNAALIRRIEALEKRVHDIENLTGGIDPPAPVPVPAPVPAP